MADQPLPAPIHDAGRERILEVLDQHDVQFVVIGGAASQSRGWLGVTADVDVTPARETENLTRLRPHSPSSVRAFASIPNATRTGSCRPVAWTPAPFAGKSRSR